jgi:LysM repeat protein
MYIHNTRLRRTLAAVALSIAGLALAAGGVVRAGTDDAPDSSAHHVAGAQTADIPPGSARDPVAGAAERKVSVVDRYQVVAGDSYWAIAEQQLPGDVGADELSKLAEALIDHNAQRLGYADPAMIKPGDVVDVVVVAPRPAAPVAVAPERAVAPATHAVVAGDSYWAIAESGLGEGAAPADVRAMTEELSALNSARLRYDDPRMIQPGDVVYLEAAAAPTTGDIVREDARVLVAAAQQMLSAEPTAKRVETPTSPPLSELAIIATSASAETAAASSPAALPAHAAF